MTSLSFEKALADLESIVPETLSAKMERLMTELTMGQMTAQTTDQMMEAMTEQMGYWVDLTKPYITLENTYIESVWWALKRYFDEGMMYKGYKIQPYCPRCETPLSSHEVSLGYQDVKDPSVYVKMRLKKQPDTSFLVWTTTPWTLISNVALAVAPDVDYVKVEHKGEKLILAEARLCVLDGEYSVLETMKGRSFVGSEYERVFDEVFFACICVTALPVGRAVPTSRHTLGRRFLLHLFHTSSFIVWNLGNLPLCTPQPASGIEGKRSETSLRVVSPPAQ